MNIRRVIAALSSIAILSTLVVSTAVASFSDVESGLYYSDAVTAVEASGAADGDTFEPGTLMTRADAARFAVLMSATPVTPHTTATFTDVPTDHDDFEYIESAVDAQIISGYGDDTFGPGDNLTRIQYAKIVVEAFGIDSYVPSNATFSDVIEGGEGIWAGGFEYVETAAHAGVIEGLGGANAGKFGPNNNLNRADGAVMVNRAAGGEDVVVPDPVEPEPEYEGGLKVSVSDDSPDAEPIPDMSTGVVMGMWDFEATDGDVMLEALTISTYSLSALPAGHSLFLYDGANRLTSGKSINSSTKAAIFNNLNLEIDDGDTLTLSLRLNVGTTGISTSVLAAFQIEEAAVDAGDAEVDGDFPLETGVWTISDTDGGSVTVTKNGTVSNASIGEKDATIAKFKIEAATEDALIKEIGIYIAGTVSTSDLENFKLYAAGETDPVAEVDSLNSSDVAQFVLDDEYVIEKGDTRSFWMSADFNTGRSGDTVFAYIDESTDVTAEGGTYHYGMGVTFSGYDGDASGTACATGAKTVCNALTLEGGDITISGSTIATRNIAVNQNDVTILEFAITSQSDVVFDNFGMHLDMSADTDETAGLISDATGTPANITDIKIKEVGGSHVWGPIDADVLVTALNGSTVIGESTDAADAFYLFTDDLSMDAGETKEFILTVDTANETALADATLTATIDIDSTYPTIKDSNNKTLTNSSSLVPTSDYSGDAFTITSDGLTVVRSAAVGSKTVVVGAQDVEMLAMSFGAGDASDIKVTTLKLTGYIDDNGSTFEAGKDSGTDLTFNEVVLSLDLYEGSIAEENKLNASSQSADSTTGEVEFTGLNWTIDAGETVTLIATGKFAKNTAYDTDQLKVDIADVSADIEAENEDGNNIDSTSSDGPNGTTTSSSTLYTQVTMSAGGTLAIDVPTNTPSSEIVVAGTSANEFAKLKFTATEEAFKIEKLALKNAYSSTAGDYDDNISTLRIKYFTDEAQTAEETTTCSAASTTGVYECKAMTMMVPDPDTTGAPAYALLTIEADLNEVADSLADEGDAPAFTLSFAHDFEANGQSSGKKIEEAGTYELSVTDDVVASVTSPGAGYYSVISSATQTRLYMETNALLAQHQHLYVGTEWMDVTAVGTNYVDVVRGVNASTAAVHIADAFAIDTTEDLNAAITSTTATSVVTDGNTAAAYDTIKIGTEEMFVTATDAGTPATLTVIRGVNGTTAATHADDAVVYESTPNATDELDYIASLATNYMQVQATDLALVASTGSRTGSTGSTEAVLTFTATANAAQDAQLRQGYYEGCTTDATSFVNAGTGTTSSNASAVAGNGLVLTVGAGPVVVTDGGAELYQFSAGDAADYARVSFWVKWHDEGGATALPVDDVKFVTSDDAILTGSQVSSLGSTALTEDIWYFFDMAVPTGTATGDDYFGLYFFDGVTLVDATAANAITLDEVIFYNEKINVDLKLNENWAAVTPTVAYLKQNDTTVASAYVDFDGVVSSKTGQIQFVPVSTYATIDISGADTFVVEMDTTSAITEDSDATENLTATIDIGNVGTAGDLYWYDGSSILNFLGVNSTDNISTVSKY